MEAIEDVGMKTPVAASSAWGRPVVALSNGLDRVNEAAYVIATAGFATVMAVGVFFRYALNNSLTWADEVAMMFFVWATCTASTWGCVSSFSLSRTVGRPFSTSSPKA
jgi:TRAP-type C4-dicarboxylate transport system permease small subunit